MTELRVYKSDAKPPVLNGQIKDYFRQRLHGEQAGIDIAYDAFRNRVFTSRGHREATLYDPHPATLVASAQGIDIMRRNRGLLHRIAQGEMLGDQVAEGTEARVFKIELNTAEGERNFALKYTFPVDRDGDYFYTPGIDQMRLLQEMRRQQPLPGLHVAVPVLATMDMTLTPFVENAVEAEVLSKAMYSRSPDTDSIAELPISEEDKTLLRTINSDREFSVVGDFIRVKSELKRWIETQVDLAALGIISRNISSVEAGSERNILVSLDTLREFYKRCKDENYSIFENRRYQDFISAIRDCCTIVELTAGYK